jgi:hypothetical protein
MRAMLVLYSIITCVKTGENCARWNCGSVLKGTCAHSEIIAGEPNVVVDSICDKKSKKYCDLVMSSDEDGYPSVNYSVYREPKADYHCQNMKEKEFIRRYPGEDCTKDEDCNYIQNCTNKKCVGFGVGERTNESYTCVAGTYFDEELGTCQYQKGLNEKCSSVWECQNKYSCYNHMCIEYASIPENTIVDDKLTDDDYSDVLCYTLWTDSTGKCSKWDYADSDNVDSDGFKLCDKNESCRYTNSRESMKCVCGINSAGQGYCPRPIARGIYYYLNFIFWVR